MKAVYQNAGKAIYCDSSYGPTFGDKTQGLRICHKPQENILCSAEIGHTYLLPSGQSGTTFLMGGQYLSVSELEVFGLKK